MNPNLHPGNADFLLAGDSGLGQDEIQSQMLLWAMMAAPLISSAYLTKISPAALAVPGNTDVIAVDRDPLGLQRQIVQRHTRSDVMSKPPGAGSRPHRHHHCHRRGASGCGRRHPQCLPAGIPRLRSATVDEGRWPGCLAMDAARR